MYIYIVRLVETLINQGGLNMKAEIILNRMKALIEKQGTKQLCEAFELTNNLDTSEAPIAREALMDELEKRNPEAFESWIMTEDVDEMDFPSLFFV